MRGLLVLFGLIACGPPDPEILVPSGEPRDIARPVDYAFEPDSLMASLNIQLVDRVPSLEAFEFASMGVSLAHSDRFTGSITTYRDHCGVALDVEAAVEVPELLDAGYLGAWRVPAGGAVEVHGECDLMDPAVWGDDPSAPLVAQDWIFAVTGEPSGTFDDWVAPILERVGLETYGELEIVMGDDSYPVGPVIFLDYSLDEPEYLEAIDVVDMEDGLRIFSYAVGTVPMEAL